MNTAKRRGMREKRTVPWSGLLPTGEDEGSTVDPARFRGPGEPYEGHWREFPAPWPSPEKAAFYDPRVYDATVPVLLDAVSQAR